MDDSDDEDDQFGEVDQSGEEDAGDEDDGDLTFWESAADSAVRQILESAEIDSDERTVAVTWEDWGDYKRDDGRRVFSSLDELRHALIEVGDEKMISHVPWEGGPVFETDSDDIVDGILSGSQVERFFEGTEVPDDAQLLLEIGDLLNPGQSAPVRLDLEEIDARLIKLLAQRPELMHELNSRKFEELLAELFRGMGYEVVLTHRQQRMVGSTLRRFERSPTGRS